MQGQLEAAREMVWRLTEERDAALVKAEKAHGKAARVEQQLDAAKTQAAEKGKADKTQNAVDLAKNGEASSRNSYLALIVWMLGGARLAIDGEVSAEAWC
jgi:hypothetical protein